MCEWLKRKYARRIIEFTTFLYSVLLWSVRTIAVRRRHLETIDWGQRQRRSFLFNTGLRLVYYHHLRRSVFHWFPINSNYFRKSAANKLDSFLFLFIMAYFLISDRLNFSFVLFSHWYRYFTSMYLCSSHVKSGRGWDSPENFFLPTVDSCLKNRHGLAQLYVSQNLYSCIAKLDSISNLFFTLGESSH